MVKEADQYGAVSSIALLRKRFRQIEKTKELRQGKQLLQMLSDERKRERMFLSGYYNICQLSLSLGLPPEERYSLMTKQRAPHAPPPPKKNIPLLFDDNDAPRFCTSLIKILTCNSSVQCSESDIDTSLHL
ncbi:hypothetical protein ABFS83_08G153200 [Erythranthe nasuta]